MSQMARKYNIPYATLVCRLDRDGLSAEEAISKVANKHAYEYQGKTQSLRDWANELDVSYHKLYSRIITLGWSFERAITE
jgi:hypothetical protein